MPDSSAIDQDDAGRDGHRIVVACGQPHLNAIIAQARDAWVDEELWFGRLERASRRTADPAATVEDLARRAGLSADDLHRALDWNARRQHTTTALPTGQSLPDQR